MEVIIPAALLCLLYYSSSKQTVTAYLWSRCCAARLYSISFLVLPHLRCLVFPVEEERLPISRDRLSLWHFEPKDIFCWGIANPVVFCSSCSHVSGSPLARWSALNTICLRAPDIERKLILWNTEQTQGALGQTDGAIHLPRWNFLASLHKTCCGLYESCVCCRHASLQSLLGRPRSVLERLQICRIIDCSAVKDLSPITS